MLRNPAFEEDKIDVAMTAERSSVARRNDELFGIVGREIQQAVWGDDHPYARTTEYATLDAITRDDLVQFYDYFYVPNNIMLAVWGNFEPSTMLAQLQETFGDWEREENPIPEISDEPTASASRRVLVADKQDLTQARFAVGQVGMRADDPDFYAMSVMNRILGGGFGDRLFNEVRSNLGLAYNVGSTAGVSMSRPGTFQAYCGTKNGTTEQALEAVLGEIDKMRDAPVEDAELKNAKEAILNSHVFNFVSKSQVLTRMMNYEYLGYPEDYLETYTEKVRAVDATAVQDVAQRRIDPSKFAIVAVGKTDEFDGDLTAFGPVKELDITIPEPEGEEFPEPTAETIEQGRAILAAARDAMGGAKLTGLKSMIRSESITLSVQGMEMAASMTAQVEYPTRMHVSISLPFGEMLQVVDENGGWMKGPQGIQDMGGDEADDMRSNMLQDPYYILGHFDGFEVQALEGEEVDGTVSNVVLVRIDDEKWVKLYFDAATNLIQKSASMEKHPMTQTPGLMELSFGDFKAVSGIQFAHSTTTTHGGEPFMSAETTKVEVNGTLDDAAFAKPSS